MEFTYIDLINGFNDWCQDNMLDIKSQMIFFKILYLVNRAGWKEWTEISNLRLMDLSGITNEKSFIIFRDKLIELDFIEYQKGKKSQPNKYKICTDNFEKIKQKYTVKLTGKKDSQKESTIDSKSGSINDSTSGSHSKSKDKELRHSPYIPTSGDSESESFDDVKKLNSRNNGTSPRQLGTNARSLKGSNTKPSYNIEEYEKHNPFDL